MYNYCIFHAQYKNWTLLPCIIALMVKMGNLNAVDIFYLVKLNNLLLVHQNYIPWFYLL